MKGQRILMLGLVGGAAVSVGCAPDPGLRLPAEQSGPVRESGLKLVARIAHITDAHVLDTASPARVAQVNTLIPYIWRPYEAYAMQLLDGIIRTVNRLHASGRTIDLLVHTGDACDNVQSNELAWLLTILDGGEVAPLSGPDDRPPETRPPPALDPYAPFAAQGLYRQDRHGAQPSIPWYTLLGNHDVYSAGAFPVFEAPDGHRTAPLPQDWRPGVLLPVRLDPVGSCAYSNVTPADPGPPSVFVMPRYVEPNPARAYFSKPEYVQALFETASGPPGHGFEPPENAATWYSVGPLAGVRLIGLDTTDAVNKRPGGLYFDGALSRRQLAFLQGQLDAALARGELVVVASHHPSQSLVRLAGSEVTGEELRGLLNTYPNVALHLAGHWHRNRVLDRGGYLEIETCSTLDLPQEGRLIEIWRDEAAGRVVVTYEMFSHLDDTLPALGADPLRALRVAARAIAVGDKDAVARQKQIDPSGEDPYGAPVDRSGAVLLPR